MKALIESLTKSLKDDIVSVAKAYRVSVQFNKFGADVGPFSSSGKAARILRDLEDLGLTTSAPVQLRDKKGWYVMVEE